MWSLALFAFSAQAQMLEPDLCMRSIGVSAGAALAGRDWDLTTPDQTTLGPFALTASPALWQGCQEDARWQWVTWFGVSAIPLYQHSYGGALDERLPLLGLITWGAGNEISYRTMIGGELVTNGVMFGAGVRINTSLRTGIAMRQGPDLRVRYLFGATPEVQFDLLWHFPAHQTVMVPDAEHPPWLTGRRLYVQAGFEVGALMGVRGRIGNAERGIGLRIGERTALRREMALQPIGLVFFETPMGFARLVVSGGTARVDGDFLPIGGAALGTKGKLFRGHAGVLAMTDAFSANAGDSALSLAPDVGLSWTW